MHVLLRTARPLALLLGACAWPFVTQAQVSLYSYSESVEAYTEITVDDGGYSLGTPTWWPPVYNQRAFVDPNNLDGTVTNGYLGAAQGPGFPIGFDLTFNGDVFDRVGISNSGWISFGKSSDGNQAVWTYSIDHPHGMPFVQYYGGPSVPYKRNRVAGYGTGQLWMQDMTPQVPPGPVSSLRIATIGTAPNRVCVIQWKDFLNAYPPSSSRINFQIRLNEADNSVEVRYGQMLFSSISQVSAQVGLGGRVPEDFNSRMTVYEQPAFLYDWNITAAGTVNTDVCLAVSEQPGHPNGSGVPPVAGRTFKWTPSTCPPPAWPLTISETTFQSAFVTWTPTPAGEYAYYVSTENDINGPEVASGSTTDPEAVIEGLSPMTTYYVFIQSMCGGEPGVWSTGTPFQTLGGGFVICDGTTMQEDYCSHQFSTVDWSYVSEDGSPLKIEFQGGFIGTAGTESFKIWDGGAPTGAAGFTGHGDLTGQTFLASSGQIYIRLVTDAGACEAQPWYLPLQWRVGCKNCTDPLVQFSLGDVVCDEQQYYVNTDIFSLGSSATLSLENSLGLPATVVSTTGVHAVGPFPAGQSVTITAQNPDNAMCYSASGAFINLPCALVDCGPTTYTYCYGDNEWSQWAYQGAGGQEIGIRFLQGSMGLGDDGRIYNGADPDMAVPVDLQSWGSLMNAMYTSSAPSTDRTLVLELVSDNENSCANGGPLFDPSQEWKYVVACYDGCTQPQATFASTCLSPTQYEVAVTISQLGSTGSVTITNNGGAPSVTATAVGTYTVGPFTAGTPATVEVEGASVLCSWTSPVQNPDCSSVPTGVADATMPAIRLFPNPSDGLFNLELPQGMSGATDLLVADLSGRVVAQQRLNGTGRVGVDLSRLPNGLYTLTLRNNEKTANGRISIQH
ncbi:MAG: T9SS type A sorting domain-containing protein [Bacteroidetes bacterium]|nr:T9SS type A sorting domain-containing protein [Bacteroidota bacterium]